MSYILLSFTRQFENEARIRALVEHTDRPHIILGHNRPTLTVHPTKGPTP